MLAETVGGDSAPVLPSGKFHRQPGDVELADRLVPDPPDGSALAQMRMGHGLVHAENRRAGHTFRFQRRNRGVAARKTAEPALDDVRGAALLSRLARGVSKRGSSANSGMFIALIIWFH
jgi:hypothetical protein